MSYQVLARKWRPQRFADVLGQEHITRTLQNAIQTSRVGHAYLFVGPRGIGKTTSARIFAKALNCTNPQTDAEGHIEPCCECFSCQEIAACNCLDVIEIDGASHNKVEDIRDLCENVQYAPTNGRQYKIYIIDEVHMLTTQAWNALLKTLEEPPAHVKFLFATTEAHKVLATILSRTQRFDLRRIPAVTIVERLRQIADLENVYIDDDALNVIARAAEGGMRDAQSIFDQMIAFCGGLTPETQISEADVIEVFGMASVGELRRIQHAMLHNEPGILIEAVHNLADKGRDLEKLYGDLLQGLRGVMVAQVVSDPAKILELSPNEATDLQQLAAGVQPSLTQRLVEGLLAAGDQIRHTLNKRVFLEVTLLKVMQDAHAVQVDDLLAVLRNFRDSGDMPELPKVGVGTPVAPPTPPPAKPPVAPPPAQPKVIEAPPVQPEPVSPPPAAPTIASPEPIAPPPPPVQESVAPPAARPEPIAPPAPISQPPQVEQRVAEPQSTPAMVPDPVAPPAPQFDQRIAEPTAAATEPEPVAPPTSPQPAAAPVSPQGQDDGNEPGVDEDGKRTFRKGAEVLEEVRQNPFVKQVCDLFDGNVIDARA